MSDTAVTVLRHGKHVAIRPTAERTNTDLIHMMVGRDMSFDRCSCKKTSGTVVLDMQNLCTCDDCRLSALRDARFNLARGQTTTRPCAMAAT